MERNSFDIFLEAASTSHKLASLVLDCQRIKVESATSDAAIRLHEKVGTNMFKQPASNIHSVASMANVDLTNTEVDKEIAETFRNASVPDFDTPEFETDDVTVEPKVDEVDSEGIMDNPSDESINEFCELLAQN